MTIEAPTQMEVFALAQEKGWHSKQDALIRFLAANNASDQIIEHARATWLATRIALIHAEVSEAMELLRRPAGVTVPDWGEELADIGLRLKDLAEDTGVNLAVAEANKHAKNKTREQTHGGKVL